MVLKTIFFKSDVGDSAKKYEMANFNPNPSKFWIFWPGVICVKTLEPNISITVLYGSFIIILTYTLIQNLQFSHSNSQRQCFCKHLTEKISILDCIDLDLNPAMGGVDGSGSCHVRCRRICTLVDRMELTEQRAGSSAAEDGSPHRQIPTGRWPGWPRCLSPRISKMSIMSKINLHKVKKPVKKDCYV